MANNELNNLGHNQVPEQQSGSEMNAVATEMMDTLSQASAFYTLVKQRLLAVNSWYEFAELPAATFKLFDHSGAMADRAAQVGDYIRIDIPGPGTKAGEGYDWVIIEELTEEVNEDSELITMKVRPSAHPSDKADHPAHFLESIATATFQVKHMGIFVQVEQHGRNEVPNTHTTVISDNIRNTLVGWTAKLGLSYPQWKSLVEGLIKRP